MPEQIRISTPPSEKYPGKGAVSLFDLKKGTADLHDGSWLGFLSDTVSLEVIFMDKINCNKLIVSTI
ncbi:hypothetical protein H6A11_08855, partial [Bifidobacterium pullorum subsp. saeculare]|uniref:hypothetical protein n=1 Tax=Bifidobacterium pullorum TaxID=78448 RepID=UPI00195C148C